MLAVACVTPVAPAARARAIDHDQPIANSTSTPTEMALNVCSALLGERRNPRGRRSGNASIHSPVVALRRGGGELERLSSILPRDRSMHAITALFHRLADLPALLQGAGLFGLATIIFSETGLLIGVFLPGDSLLVTAGLIAARGYLNIFTLIPTLTIAAVLGNSVGHFIGRASGP